MHQLNPWKTNSKRTVYENPWISVREDQVIQPNGSPGIYGVVHFKNKAVGILPIDHEGYVYLVGQFRYPLDEYSWEIPEGGCPEDEDPLVAAKRELLEETGLSAGKWQDLGRAHLSNSVSDEEAIFFLATDLVQGQAEPEETEQFAHKRLPFAEVCDMVMRGDITDSLTIMAILRYAYLTRTQS